MTSARFIPFLVKEYPSPIERLREQATLEALKKLPSLLEKYKRLCLVT